MVMQGVSARRGIFCFSAAAAEYSKEFTISVVLGKDVVPRIGLHQMEAMRADVINAIKRSVDSKVSGTRSCNLPSP